MDDYLAKPVRPEDVRAVIERWGKTAGTTAPQDEPKIEPTPALAPAPGSTSEQPKRAPVDLVRLAEFTDGSFENTRDLVALYVSQTGEQIKQLQAAVKAALAQDVRRLAHSAAGASGTCGVVKLAGLLRQLEHQAAEQNLANAPQLASEITAEFELVCRFLEKYLTDFAEPLPKS